MSMSKKDFVALADKIRYHNAIADDVSVYSFRPSQLDALADFCREQNPRFMRDRWLSYIAGECGKNGGKVRP